MCILFNSATCVKSVRVNILVSETLKNTTDLIIEQSVDLYGYTPKEKSDENEKWMRRNGYLGKKRVKRGIRGRRFKSEI